MNSCSSGLTRVGPLVVVAIDARIKAPQPLFFFVFFCCVFSTGNKTQIAFSTISKNKGVILEDESSGHVTKASPSRRIQSCFQRESKPTRQREGSCIDDRTENILRKGKKWKIDGAGGAIHLNIVTVAGNRKASLSRPYTKEKEALSM